MEMGFVLTGMFMSTQSFENQDGSVTESLMIATDRGSYRVYLSRDVDVSDFEGLKPGEIIQVVVSPRVTEKGRLVFGGGKLAI